VLTAIAVAQLKLHPGLVILSACNTASADGTPGAEGLSGLAKAFFYAGSQSLLVSLWSVPSEAAKLLTTGVFANLKNCSGIGRSEALRRSMMTLATDDNFSHPVHWAPFSLVSDAEALRLSIGPTSLGFTSNPHRRQRTGATLRGARLPPDSLDGP